MTVPTSPRRFLRKAITVPVVLAALALFLAIAPGPGAARAAGGDILVSLDGVNWSATLPVGLFAGEGTVVPGDSMSRTLWIDNTTSSPAILRLSRMEPAPMSPLSRAMSLTATVAGSNRIPPSVTDGTCVQLTPDEILGAGRSISIVVTLTIADLAGTEAQGGSAPLSLLASLSAVGGTAASPCAAGGTRIPVLGTAPAVSASDGSLAYTGGGLPYPAIMIASLLTGLGLFALLAARRRRRAE
ncbi:hypothetical protein [Lacisediminihabitans sp.]|uniref:hypothetical protein n=1 Tax=Lacisediminihabitans sp. TaxID=2787631 RepID=UPI00374DBF67